jgi:hypothetical protein
MDTPTPSRPGGQSKGIRKRHCARPDHGSRRLIWVITPTAGCHAQWSAIRGQAGAPGEKAAFRIFDSGPKGIAAVACPGPVGESVANFARIPRPVATFAVERIADTGPHRKTGEESLGITVSASPPTLRRPTERRRRSSPASAPTAPGLPEPCRSTGTPGSPPTAGLDPTEPRHPRGPAPRPPPVRQGPQLRRIPRRPLRSRPLLGPRPPPSRQVVFIGACVDVMAPVFRCSERKQNKLEPLRIRT